MKKITFCLLISTIGIFLSGCGKETPPDITLKKLNMQAVIFAQQENYPEAEKTAQEAVDLAEEYFTPDHGLRQSTLMTMGGIYFNEGKSEEALPYFQQVIESITEKEGKDSVKLIDPLSVMGNIYEKQGKNKESLGSYQRVLELTKKQSGEFHPDVATVLNKLATIAYNLKMVHEAEDYYRKLIEVSVRVYGKDHEEVAKVLDQVSLFYRLTGHEDAAKETADNALKIRGK